MLDEGGGGGNGDFNSSPEGRGICFVLKTADTQHTWEVSE